MSKNSIRIIFLGDVENSSRDRLGHYTHGDVVEY